MDATFWALVGLIIFIGVIVYFKVPAMITKSLDERADGIRKELEEARSLREEAQALLAEYQKKQQRAEEDAAEIVEQAKKDASHIVEEARAKSEDYVKRREAMAAQKIEQAERDAVQEVRSRATDVAIAAAAKLLGDQASAKTAGDQFKASLEEIRQRMN